MSYKVIGKGNLGKHLQRLLQRNEWVENVFFPKAKIFYIAVKPKDVKDACKEISPKIMDKDIVVSCAAGIRLDTLETYLPKTQIVRCMPNICISSGSGAIVWHGPISINDIKILELMMRGPTHMWVEDEAMLDKATLLFASQPAFQATFAKAYITVAIQSGFTEKQARQLLADTIIGTGELLLDSTPDEIIKQVCSKGGVTERALKTIRDASIESAQKRSLYDGFMHLHSMIEKFN